MPRKLGKKNEKKLKRNEWWSRVTHNDTDRPSQHRRKRVDRRLSVTKVGLRDTSAELITFGGSHGCGREHSDDQRVEIRQTSNTEQN